MTDTQTEIEAVKIPSTHVRYTAEQYARLKRMMDSTGMSAPDLLKDALFKRTDLERPYISPEVAGWMLSELRRAGNNLNQIARGINSGIRHGWSPALNGVTQIYASVRHALSVNRIPGSGACPT
jgi:hypothetical protein